MVAGAIVVGAALSVWASTYGTKLELNNFAKSLFYYLFMYGVGLRVGPSFINSLGGDGLKFSVLAVVSCVLGLAIIVIGVKLLDLPPGTAGGILAGSQTMSAAIGSAEQAAYVIRLPDGVKPEDAASMVALSYGITYIWGTVGIILICKYLPRWWGIDAKAAAKQYEAEFGVKDIEGGGLTGFRPFGLRAYRLENPKTGRPEHRELPPQPIPNTGSPTWCAATRCWAPIHRSCSQLGDIVALGGKIEALTDKMGLIGPEVADQRALNVPLDQAEILVTNKDIIGKELGEFRDSAVAGQVQVGKYERGGVPFPAGLKTQLQRMDIISVVGLKGAVQELADKLGRIARPSTATDLLTLSVGMIIGFLIGMIEFPAFGSKVGLGNAGGLLLSGVIVSSLVSRLRFFGNTPNAARNILEDLGLVVFVAIVGVNAGNSAAGTAHRHDRAEDLRASASSPARSHRSSSGRSAITVFKINPAVLMGGVAGARSHSGPCREAAVEIQSSVPWIGFPVAYALSGILLTVFGYFAMILAQ